MPPALTVQTPDGRSLDVWLAGPADGQPLVFHLGTPCSGLPFDGHVAAMAERNLRFVSMSRPGYGSSSRHEGRSVADAVADTRLVMDELGIDRAYMAGWSGGGPHALACAALMPERVRATAILAGVAPYPAEGLDWMAGMGHENVEEFGAAIEGPDQLRAFIERDAPAFRDMSPADVATAFGDLVDEVDRAAATGPFAAYMAALAHEALRESYWGWLDDTLAFVRPWGFDLAAIAGTTHIWQGARDRMVPFAHGEWLARNVAGAIPHLFAEHGHLSLVVDAFPAILDELIDGAP